jgi:hypothetical protein
MAVIRKLGTGIKKIRDIRTTNDGTQTKVETWKGPYKLLEAKQNAIGFSAKATNLAPDGPNGILTVTYEIPAPEDYQFTGSQTSIEIAWMELRKPIEQHSMFKNVPATEIKKAKDAAELEGEASEAAAQQLDTIAKKLYDYLIKGTTEYSTGVPVVRRTKTRQAGNQGGGGAWMRDSPPVSIPGGWDWLKTADERRKDGRSFTLVEEWTAAMEWDKELYP